LKMLPCAESHKIVKTSIKVEKTHSGVGEWRGAGEDYCHQEKLTKEEGRVQRLEGASGDPTAIAHRIRGTPNNQISFPKGGESEEREDGGKYKSTGGERDWGSKDCTNIRLETKLLWAALPRNWGPERGGNHRVLGCPEHKEDI